MNGWAWFANHWFTVLYLTVAAAYLLALLGNEEKAPRNGPEGIGALILSIFWPVALLARVMGRWI